MRARIALGAPAAIWLFSIAALVQAENLAARAHGSALLLPLLQLENLGVAALIAFAGASVAAARFDRLELRRHPLVSLAASAVEPARLASGIVECKPTTALDREEAQDVPPPPDFSAQRARIAALPRPPNIV